MFCDVVESTGLAHKLDPEDLRTVWRRYQECVVNDVEQFGGSIIRYVGDGVFASFANHSANGYISELRKIDEHWNSTRPFDC